MKTEPESPNPRTPEAGAGATYDFGGRLTREFPSQIVIDATELCNLECVNCAHPHFKRTEFYSGKSLDPALSHKVADEVAGAGRGLCRYIRFTGEGEPLIAPHIFEMLDYAVTNSGTTVTITTNGSLNHPGKVERLMATGVDIVDVSIDAFSPETYARIRVKGDPNVTRANVKRMIDLSKAAGCPTKVVVSYIEQKENVHETADFEKYWKDQGADFVVIRRMHSHAGVIVQIARNLHEVNTRGPRRPCLYPWERIVLNPRGFLSFCPNDWVHGSNIADYRTTTIAETWQSEFYSRLRRAHLANCYAHHDFCGQCPDWASTRWPSEGRSYADLVEDFKGCE